MRSCTGQLGVVNEHVWLGHIFKMLRDLLLGIIAPLFLSLRLAKRYSSFIGTK